jgi:hypothetical protein
VEVQLGLVVAAREVQQHGDQRGGRAHHAVLQRAELAIPDGSSMVERSEITAVLASRLTIRSHKMG